MLGGTWDVAMAGLVGLNRQPGASCQSCCSMLGSFGGTGHYVLGVPRHGTQTVESLRLGSAYSNMAR